MTECQGGTDDFLVCQRALVAIDDGHTIGPIAGARVDQCAKNGLF